MIFYCLHCDSSRDSDHDADCGPDPDNAQYLICGPCLEASQSQPCGALKGAATYACDICESPVSAAHVHTRDGKILGLIVCTQCVEDNLAARQLEDMVYAHHTH